MTWEEIENKLNYFIYEKPDHTIWMKTVGRDKLLGLHELIYLCKLCYEENKV